MTLKEKLERRAALVQQVRGIVNKVKGEKRDLTDEEKQQCNGLLDEAERLRGEIDREHEGSASHRSNAPRPGSGMNERLAHEEWWNEQPMKRQTSPSMMGYGGDSSAKYIDAEGREIPVLTREQRLSDCITGSRGYSGSSRLSLGKTIRGIITGNWRGAEDERREVDMGLASPTAGGYLVAPQMAGWIIDLARAQSVCVDAGARTVPMESSEMTIARVTSDPTVYWRPENTAITTSGMTLGRVNMRARTLAALVPISLELAEDAPNSVDLIERAIARQVALKLDYAILRGEGTGEEPCGILNADGTQDYSVDWATANGYDAFSIAAQKVWEKNGNPNAVVYSPQYAGYLDRLRDNGGRPMQPPQSFQNLRKFTTTQIPGNLGANSDETEAYLGDFSTILLGIRTNLIVQVSQESHDGKNSAFSKMQVHVRVYGRYDVAFEHEEWLVKMTGLKPSVAN